MHNSMAVHRSEGFEAVANDRNRDPRFESRLFRTDGNQDIIDVFPSLFTEPFFNRSKHFRSE